MCNALPPPSCSPLALALHARSMWHAYRQASSSSSQLELRAPGSPFAAQARGGGKAGGKAKGAHRSGGEKAAHMVRKVLRALKLGGSKPKGRRGGKWGRVEGGGKPKAAATSYMCGCYRAPESRRPSLHVLVPPS